MTTKFRFPWLLVMLGALLLVSASGSVWWLGNQIEGVGGPLETFSGGTGETTVPPLENGATIVCLGRVDVVGGVTKLNVDIPGKVTKILVKENDQVQAGALLLRLEDRSARLRLTEAEVALQTAQSHLQLAQKADKRHQIRIQQQQAVARAASLRRSAAANLLRQKQRLRRRNLIDETELAAFEDQVAELSEQEIAQQARLEELRLNDPGVEHHQAQLQVKAARIQLDQARHALDQCSLKAPVAGTVLRLLVQPGETVPNPTQPAVLWLAPNGPRVVRVEVTQEFARHLRVGQPARIEDESGKGPTWRGEVLRIASWYSQRRNILNEPFQLKDVRTRECLITFNSDQNLPVLGQRLRVTVYRSP